ncbi:uncharacterized protein LTR77_006286 [Saxophila tyrrhenica]|uniref:Transcriptional co-activator n=1 Tax=Saxophila tyrrhenica TaxID=1690608 RepID=A0AAV9PBD7_9PEZI|nr:hypothetical protein LTR77_006286 [Saxophila tyrrhenica]
MNPADLTLNISPSLSNRPLAAPAVAKNGKAPVPRVDLEPIYTQLKSALGEGWGEYKAAVGAFVLGSLNQAELSWVLQPLLPLAPAPTTSTSTTTSPPSILQLHNTLLASIYANTLRDPPPTEVAPWVVATDKPTSASKTSGAGGVNDKAEERLKKEVMAIHPRDRRRIKTLKDNSKVTNDGLADMQDYRHELAVKPPDVTPASAGGLQRTNWDIEIRRRYAQTLAEETLEFPTQGDVQNRIEPICYEEGLVGGVAQGSLQQCAEIVEQATEVFLKEMLSGFYAHSRSNGEGCIQTGKFKRQLRKEEEDAERGALQRNPAGFLPAELEMQTRRQPLEMEDLRLSVQLSDTYMKREPFLSQRVVGNRFERAQQAGGRVNGVGARGMVNGTGKKDDEDAMVVDDDMSWRGATRAEGLELRNVLDGCLSVG